MALPKLFNRIFWHNNTTPAINEDNLNSMSKALDDIDNRVIELGDDILEDLPEIIEALDNLDEAINTVAGYASTAQTAATTATNKAGEASASATTASNKADEAAGSALTASDKADAAAGSATTAGNQADAAAASATSSANQALKSEGYAVGEQNGTEVTSGSPYYQNNAKYFSDEAAQSASDAADSAAEAGAWSAHPPYIGANGNWYVYNTTTEAYVDSGIDASITVAIQDITMLPTTSAPYVTNTGTSTDPVFHLFIPMGVGISSIEKTGASGLTDTYTITFTDESTTTFQIVNGKSAYAYAVEGGYQGSEEQFESDLANFQTYATQAAASAGTAASSAADASGSALSSQTDALKSEGFAVGQQNGQDVPSTSPYYENNAKYWSDLAAQYAQSFSGLKFMGSIAYSQIPASGMSNGDWYDINEAFVTDSRFEEGAGLACAAGTDIVWVEQDGKWNILTPSGVYSFNGRQGAVSPAAGDYSANDISYGSGSNVAAALNDKEKKSTILTTTLSAGATSVTFSGLPTSGNHIIDFYTSTGINYTAINTSTAGQVTLTYDTQGSAVTVYCKIMEV